MRKPLKRSNELSRMTLKERRFCLEYLVDYNATRAAVVAGYSEKTAAVQAAKLLKKPHIKSYVDKMEGELVEDVKLRKEDILTQLYYALTRTVDDFVGPDGDVLPMSQMDVRAKSMIDGFEQEVRIDGETGEKKIKTKVKLVGKLGAIELAMKHKGLFEADKHDHNHKVSLDWDSLVRPINPDEEDIIEGRIADARDQDQ
jgi:phage terminase small subunit